MGTLSIGKKPSPPPPPAAIAQPKTEPDPLQMPDEEEGASEPVFDPSAHYGEVGGVPGVKYVQGDSFFKANFDFHSVAPPEARLKPLTREQEADRQKRLANVRKLFGTKLAQSGNSPLPENVIAAARENARARVAENLSE